MNHFHIQKQDCQKISRCREECKGAICNPETHSHIHEPISGHPAGSA